MSFTELLVESVENAYDNRKDFWEDSPFRKLTLLTNDERGSWGEKALTKLFDKVGNIKYEWDQDKNTNQRDGIYDIVVLKNDRRIRVEVKTATIGQNNSWQHENIYKKQVWDKLVFIDVDYFSINITVIDYSQMTFDSKHSVFGRKPTLRSSQDDKYKFDFGKSNIQRGIDNGYTFCYNILNPDEKGLVSFLTEKFS
jgi:hypothetical protein